MSSGNSFRQRTEDGAVAVETGILVSILVLLIFGALELADAWWTYNTMLLAIGEAGRYAMVYDSGSPPVCSAQKPAPRCPAPSDTPLANCAAARAQQILSLYRAAKVSASVTEDAGSPATATICASFSLGSLGTLLPDLPVNLTSRVTVPLI